MSMNDVLKQGVNGGNLLFCGAGFSADCLNFSEESLGTLQPLLKELNDALGYNYTDIQYATDAYLDKHGQNGLLDLLKEKYAIFHNHNTVDAILKYPWDRIYTTNYDNVIKKSLDAQGIRCQLANNTDDPYGFEQTNNMDTKWIVHLHGSIERWNSLDDFEKSCVLGHKSYMEIGVDSKWLSTFRKDYARAKGVFFVGFSNREFYFAKELYSVEASKDKVFFINSEESREDINLQASQKDYGSSHSIGKEGFVDRINLALESKETVPPNFSHFEHCELVEPSKERASVDQQRSFFISGRKDDALHYRDVLDSSCSYRAKRESTDRVVEFLQQDNSVALVLGGICSGKTTILDECVIRLLMDGHDVFRYKANFGNLLEEVETIINDFPESVVVIDDCFSLKELLREVVKRLNEAGHRLLLASRSVVHDFEENLGSIVNKETSFKIFDTEILSYGEVRELINCANRMAIWDKDVKSSMEKQKIIKEINHSRLSSFLLDVFKSESVKKNFLTEIEEMKATSKDAERALIIALYLRGIKSKVEERVLSEIIQKDAVVLFKNFESSPFISYIPGKKEFDVIPGINARQALKSFFDPKIVIDTIAQGVASLEFVKYDPFFNDILIQMMRYTQLKQVVEDSEQKNLVFNSFFDRLSELEFCRSRVLFWLQWSMAMSDQERWQTAFRYLDQAYGLANKNYNTLQLDDQRARLLLASTSETYSSVQATQRFIESCKLLITSISGGGGNTYHNYITIGSFTGFFERVEYKLSQEHKKVLVTPLKHLKKIIEKKIKHQPRIDIKKVMEGAVVSIDKALSVVQPEED